MQTLKKTLPLLSLLLCCTCSTQAQMLLPGEKAAPVSAINGVVAAGASWSRFWSDYVTADGMTGTSDGGLLFAQEQTDKIIKLNADGMQFTAFDNMHGAGSVSIDTEGRILVALRTCTEPLNDELAGCTVLTRIVQVAPESRLLAMNFPDGSSLGRVNDMIADGMGGAFVTSNGMKLPYPAVNNVFHVSAKGKVDVVVNENIGPNGITLSRDGQTLFVTNGGTIVAFDVKKDGSTGNRRDFIKLPDETFGDGMALDNEGRIYITGSKGIHVVSETGVWLGLIPTPRQAITLAFSGAGKKTLFAGMMGAVGADGQAWKTPDGIRNIAMTIYALPMQTAGFAGRPK